MFPRFFVKILTYKNNNKHEKRKKWRNFGMAPCPFIEMNYKNGQAMTYMTLSMRYLLLKMSISRSFLDTSTIVDKLSFHKTQIVIVMF